MIARDIALIDNHEVLAARATTDVHTHAAIVVAAVAKSRDAAEVEVAVLDLAVGGVVVGIAEDFVIAKS